jgi:predicted Abi (CAAX) family protease
MNQAYLDQVTRDIDFSDQATKFLENGNIVPTRLNGRRQVGPLQSLAGARPQDDMTVRLVEPDLASGCCGPAWSRFRLPVGNTAW